MALKETFYISHGSPTLSIDDSLPARHFLQSFQRAVFPQKPKSILVISGHWETDVPTVNAVDGPSDTIYDFYNFPKRMYELKYPAPGAPDLAYKVKKLLQAGGFNQVHVDKNRGLDHGAWVPLMLMYPEADIPVCQLSIQTNLDATHHYRIGKALASLKEEGVLVMGSGSATHNLRSMHRGDADDGSVASWAAEFDNWLKEALLDGRYEDVNQYESKAPYAKLAHPWPDHFFPLHVAMGASGDDSKSEVIHESWTNGTLSYTSFKFTS
ncbi:hypothetical protein M569_11332 [Genlisea aurea]|uniref:Extradiol ring-cleavage dioxygenase class III enzyme subunit B domain-containing protein n=1 Tax=Genlisea aurea TaxID=192259 RepID=S8DKU1_9LAMI|nr:hypothetical protein M569_11332 [Genlisea aurea]